MRHAKPIILSCLIIASSISLMGCPTGTAPVVQAIARQVAREVISNFVEQQFAHLLQQQSQQITQDIQSSVNHSNAVQDLSSFESVNPSIEGMSHYFSRDIQDEAPNFNMNEEFLTLDCYESETDDECLSRHETFVNESLREPLQNYNIEIEQIHQHNQGILDKTQKRLDEFNQAHTTCRDDINTDPNISLDDHVVVFENLIGCLLDLGFESELRALATESAYFSDKIDEVQNQ